MDKDYLGPWSVSGVRARTRLGRETVLRILNSKDEVNVFVLYGDGSNAQHHQAYAEANLIAAAPEMLEVLELYNTLFTSDALTPQDNEDHWEEVTRKVQAILQLLDVHERTDDAGS